MKKVLALLLICLSSTVMFAQKATPTHWTSVNDENNMTMYAVLVLDGVEQYEDALNYEIGVFDQNGDCRCAKFPKKKNNTGRYIYTLTIKGHDGLVYNFRIWDHTIDMELEATFLGEPLEFENNALIGSGNNPESLEFTTGAASGFELPITGYGEGTGHWYLIASPVGTVNPTNVTLLEGEGNMLNENGYDLFSFDQSQNGEEWRNYALSNFVLEPGKGYLYANHDDVTLVFSGEAYAETGTFDLTYDANANATGFNLVGNPFGEAAYVSMPFYTMNEGGTEIMTESTTGTVPAMNGIFVQATEEGESVTFSIEAPGDKSASLALNLSSGRNVIDRAIVRFDEGQQLNKFQLNPNSTKVYIPVDNEDFAVVRGESMGEMPVNFKAESNGNYTLSFTNENVEFAYLHLIDNMNGNDVDLLANPTYSFDALTTDYASRFKLVFATGNADDDFAFFSNGNFIINNEGNAMLQVVDVTGRILKSETINGCASVNVNAAPGVYMLRLINGDNMKVQKVVVK